MQNHDFSLKTEKEKHGKEQTSQQLFTKISGLRSFIACAESSDTSTCATEKFIACAVANDGYFLKNGMAIACDAVIHAMSVECTSSGASTVISCEAGYTR